LSSYCHQHRPNDGATQRGGTERCHHLSAAKETLLGPWAPINLSLPIKLILQGKADNEFHYVFSSMFIYKTVLILKIVLKNVFQK